ncbi:ACN9-domain-containing protein [Lichtheimia hyalospora FSU 10163]|nr:ACN9-domain-containing protein [Lichtheimia hyalospora FSU 10163]
MSKSVKEARILLAPLALYRQILRTHRYMPPAMRSMGDDYVKAEFRRHQSIDNPAHIVGFLSQWQDFNMPEGGWGKKLDSERLDKLSDEQLGQLFELRTELRKSFGIKDDK